MKAALDLAKSITDAELDYISQQDRYDCDQHKAALYEVIFDQDCVIRRPEQIWYPYECVELGRWTCLIGHEREFAICNIIIAMSIIGGEDGDNDPDDMLTTIATEYEKLPGDIRELTLATLREASRIRNRRG